MSAAHKYFSYVTLNRVLGIGDFKTLRIYNKTENPIKCLNEAWSFLDLSLK